MGTKFSGSQYQKNTPNTIQGKIEHAFQTILPNDQKIEMTGSSRTDAGVHAKMNFYHFDTAVTIENKIIKQLNSILENDIAIEKIFLVNNNFHSRFDAISREYKYKIHFNKSPFKNPTSYFYAYKVEPSILQQAAKIILMQNFFVSFSKSDSENKTFLCDIKKSKWVFSNKGCIYHIEANRFLRGMIKALVATMLRVSRKQISMDDFKTVFLKKERDPLVVFDVPSVGLTLKKVNYPSDISLHDITNQKTK